MDIISSMYFINGTTYWKIFQINVRNTNEPYILCDVPIFCKMCFFLKVWYGLIWVSHKEEVIEDLYIVHDGIYSVTSSTDPTTKFHVNPLSDLEDVTCR